MGGLLESCRTLGRERPEPAPQTRASRRQMAGGRGPDSGAPLPRAPAAPGGALTLRTLLAACSRALSSPAPGPSGLSSGIIAAAARAAPGPTPSSPTGPGPSGRRAGSRTVLSTAARAGWRGVAPGAERAKLAAAQSAAAATQTDSSLAQPERDRGGLRARPHTPNLRAPSPGGMRSPLATAGPDAGGRVGRDLRVRPCGRPRGARKS